MVNNIEFNSVEDVYKILKEDGVNLQSKYTYIHPKKTNNKSMQMTLGRIWANLCLPDEYELVDYAINKKKLNELVVNMYKQFGVEKAAKYVSVFQSEAYKLATIVPNTFNIDMFIAPHEWIEKKHEFEKIAKDLPPVEFKKAAEVLTKELIVSINDSGAGAVNIMESGAKGNPITDWGALLVAKGYTIDVEGNLLGPIVTAQNSGYGKIDYYNAAADSRKNFFMRSTMTANPGLI